MMTRKQFVATPPRDLVQFVDGQAPIVEPKPQRMSQVAYEQHIDKAGKVVIVWRTGDPADKRVFEMLTADAISAHAIWTTNDRYNERWPERDHQLFLSCRWADGS